MWISDASVHFMSLNLLSKYWHHKILPQIRDVLHSKIHQIILKKLNFLGVL